MISLLPWSALISSWSSSSLILTPWCIWHYDVCYACWIRCIIKLCSDCDWYLLWSIWDWCWVVLHLYFLISYLRIFLRVLAVSPLHSITLAMWLGVTPRGSSLARWLGSCLPMTSLSDRNMSLGNVPLPRRRTKWFCDCVLLLLLTLRTLLNAIVCCTRVRDFVVAHNLILRGACWIAHSAVDD